MTLRAALLLFSAMLLAGCVSTGAVVWIPVLGDVE